MSGAMMQRFLPLIVTTAVLVVGFLICAAQFPSFASWRVVANLLTDNAFLGITAVGMTFVILSGGIDLSVGAMIGFTTVLLAVLIIMGLWVRMSALVMSLGILLMFAWGGFGAGEPEFAWLGIYVFLIVSGGGLYAFDAALTPSDRKK